MKKYIRIRIQTETHSNYVTKNKHILSQSKRKQTKATKESPRKPRMRWTQTNQTKENPDKTSRSPRKLHKSSKPKNKNKRRKEKNTFPNTPLGESKPQTKQKTLQSLEENNTKNPLILVGWDLLEVFKTFQGLSPSVSLAKKGLHLFGFFVFFSRETNPPQKS